jgi:hypothetical protein
MQITAKEVKNYQIADEKNYSCPKWPRQNSKQKWLEEAL